MGPGLRRMLAARAILDRVSRRGILWIRGSQRLACWGRWIHRKGDGRELMLLCFLRNLRAPNGFAGDELDHGSCAEDDQQCETHADDPPAVTSVVLAKSFFGLDPGLRSCGGAWWGERRVGAPWLENLMGFVRVGLVGRESDKR